MESEFIVDKIKPLPICVKVGEEFILRVDDIPSSGRPKISNEMILGILFDTRTDPVAFGQTMIGSIRRFHFVASAAGSVDVWLPSGAGKVTVNIHE
jgi:hypothetical protein